MKRFLLGAFFISLCSFRNNLFASHLFGADFHYTHVSGTTYNIILDVYGDCSGSSFPNLPGSSPQVEVYNNNVLFQTFNLTLQGAGVEVTPVCPSQINNTTCNGGTIPGVKKFTFSNNISLSGASANWLFRFTGNMGPSSLAGRSNSITNIVVPTGGSVMVLEATLNNLSAPNSAVSYTTIPTPFFCINKPAQYNPGAVDPNNDSLIFSMVPGLITGSTVTYISPFTFSAPLATQAGTFSFSGITGQLNFTPNQAQNALVVGKVEEYRSGVLVGTSMREMTFVVLNNCNNNPPGGNISNASGGTLINASSIRVCAEQGVFSFQILPSDLDGDNITVSAAGVPAGASFTVTANGTAAPVINMSWNIINVPAGAYTFFVTYTDNGCPLSSKQTVAYIINVTPKPNFGYALVQAATCTKKAKFHVLPAGISPFTITVYQNSAIVHTITNVTGTQLDSLSPGTYTIRVGDINGCYRDTVITLIPPPAIIPGFTAADPLCNNAPNGSITALPSGGAPPYQYALGTGSYSSSPVFNNLVQGSYILHVKDANDCVKDTSVTLVSPPAILPAAFVQKPICATLGNGQVTLSAINGVSPYQYAMGTGGFSPSPVFGPLPAGTYTFHIKDNNNCTKDTSFTLVDSVMVSASVSVGNVLCNGQGNGSLAVTPSGGISPYSFALGSNPYAASGSFSGLAAGSYTVHIKDVNGCMKDTTVSISQPTTLHGTATLIQPSCYDGANGSITIAGTGGTPGYTYALDSGPFAATGTFSLLSAGTYALHVKDNNTCIFDTSLVLGQPSQIALTVSTVSLLCYGDGSGSVTVNATGGTPLYTYAADGGAFQSAGLLDSLNAGAHLIHVKDNNGCSRDTSVTVSEPPPLGFSALTIFNPTCEGFSDGSITLLVNGGTAPYVFSDNGFAYTANPFFGQLPEGSHAFFVKDNNGCAIDTFLILLGYPHLLFDSIHITPASCFGALNGAITVYASGGNPPLSYAIDNKGPAATGSFTGLISSDHTIQVADATGCIKDTTVFIPSPQLLSIHPVVTNNDCIGADDGGLIRLDVQGGSSPYTYSWSTSPQQTGETATGLANGVYTVTVKDINDCSDTASAEVTYDNCCTAFVPNAFTPNNDGKNDRVKVGYKGDMQLVQISIYNRFGQRVFYSVNINQNWDGYFNGELQDTGTYFYYLEVLCGNKPNGAKVFKGDILLIR